MLVIGESREGEEVVLKRGIKWGEIEFEIVIWGWRGISGVDLKMIAKKKEGGLKRGVDKGDEDRREEEEDVCYCHIALI